jgi:3-methyladenine DNA glycosylase AlkD
MPSDQISNLERLLSAVADEAKKCWWTNYVKGAQFLGVPMAQTRTIALDWFKEFESRDPVGVCLELGVHPISEMKLAGIAIMEHVLIPDDAIDVKDVERIRQALAAGAYDDWNACDWLCVKVIGRLVDGGRSSDHKAVLAWSTSDVLWEKRAGLVGFVNLLAQREPSTGFDGAFLNAAASVVADDRRFAQTAAGWTLRELSHREPEMIRRFVKDHGGLMSSEAFSSATKFLNH